MTRSTHRRCTKGQHTGHAHRGHSSVSVFYCHSALLANLVAAAVCLRFPMRVSR